MFDSVDYSLFARICSAAELAMFALVAAFAPHNLFGVESQLAAVAPKLSPEARGRLASVLASSYSRLSLPRRAGYLAAAIGFLLAGLCFVPSLSPALPVAAGVFAIGFGATLTVARLGVSGQRRVARLAVRRLPGSIVWILTICIAATFALGVFSANRLGSFAVCFVMLALLLLAVRLTAVPERLPGLDPRVESSVVEFVWRKRMFFAAALVVVLAAGNIGITAFARFADSGTHANRVAAIAVAAACLAISIAVFVYGRLASGQGASDESLVGALEAAPA